MKTFSLRIYNHYGTDVTTFDPPLTLIATIPDTDIVSVNIDDNRAGGDDPFEICGRMAKVKVIKLPEYGLFTNLATVPIHGNTWNVLEIKWDAPECFDYFSNLCQIIDDDTGGAIFTGLIKRDSMGYDLFGDTIEFSICDSLYVWISVAKLCTWGWTNRRVFLSPTPPECSVTEFFGLPLTNVFSPMNQTFVDLTKVMHVLVNDWDIPLEDCSPLPEEWSWAEVFPGMAEADSSSVYLRAARYSLMWEYGANDENIAVSFIALYRSISYDPDLESYRWRYRFYKAGYAKNNLSQPLHTFTETSSDIVTNYLISTMAIRGAIPSGQYGNEAAIVTGRSGENYGTEHPNIEIPTFDPNNYIAYEIEGTAYELRAAEPDTGLAGTASPAYTDFGQLTANMDIIPPSLQVAGKGTTLASIAKGLCAVYGLTMRALESGGIEVRPHLISLLAQDLSQKHPGIIPEQILAYDDETIVGLTANDGILLKGEVLEEYSLIKDVNQNPAITLNRADIINVKANGISYNIGAQNSSINAFEYPDLQKSFYNKRYADFAKEICANYAITVPRLYYDPPYLWEPFKPISLDGVILYTNAWQTLIYGDTFTIEALGGWQ